MASPHSETEEVSDFDEQMSDSFDDDSRSGGIEEAEDDEEEIQEEEFPTLIEPNGKRYYRPSIECHPPGPSFLTVSRFLDRLYIFQVWLLFAT